MLKTPPGISKRRVESRPLDEAGAVFESLYKKYLSLDADNLQKQTENYLIKHFYNKGSFKNDFNSQNSGFSEPRKLNSTQSAKSECVANTNDNLLKKTTFDLNNNSKDNKFKNNEFGNGLEDYKEDLKDLNDDLKDLKKDSRYLKEDLQDSPQDINHFQSNDFQNTLNSNFEKVNNRDNLKEKVRFEDQLPSTKQDTQKDKSRNSRYKNLIEKLKKPVKQTSKEDFRVFVEEFSDISDDSVDSKKKQKNVLTVEEFYDSEFDKVDEFLSPKNLRRKKVEDRNSLLVKNKELNFVCTVCLLFQILFTLILFGFFFLFYSFPYEDNYWFVTVLFPFLVHVAVFYVVFAFTDYTIKKRFLVYSNDYTVEVLNKRLNRELCYRKLNKYSTWGGRVLVLVGLAIACIPVSFTSDFGAFGPKEQLYLALIVGYLVLHLGFTFYYFTVKFKRLLIHTTDDDS